MAKAAKKKQESSGSEEVEADELIEAMKEFNDEDSERASDAGESRQRIGAFLERTKLNNKAFSHLRMGLRIKKESARLDWLRSLEMMLPMIAAEIKATTTTDAFDTPLAAIKAAEADKQSNVVRAFGSLSPAEQAAEVEKFEGPASTTTVTAEELAAEAEAFKAAAAETLGDEA